MPSPSPPNPTRLRALERRIDRLRLRLDRLALADERFSKVREAIFILGPIFAFFIGKVAGDQALWTTAGGLLAGYVVVVARHRRIKNGIDRHKAWLGVKTAHAARLTLDWALIPTPAHDLARPEHPFDLDLDITGERSLHRLLDTSVTREGGGRLLERLLTVRPEAADILQRQRRVAELARMTRFRDKLLLHSALASKQSAARWDVGRVNHWLDRQGSADSLTPVLILLSALAAMNVGLFTLSRFDVVPNWWPVSFFVYFMVQMVAYGAKAHEIGVFTEAVAAASTLERLGAVFRHLETYPYAENSETAKLCAPFSDPERQPSMLLKRVERNAGALGVRGNPLLWLALHAVVPWDFFFARRLNRLKADLKIRLPRWTDILFELEALNSAANFAWLHPERPFPTLVSPTDQADGPRFRACRMGHPLIPEAAKVRNDFELDSTRKIVVVTGSNMSGKSTFLRTVGVNLCLAYTGAPVDAESMESSTFGIFACIKVGDSLADGMSFFYAEVKRLRALLTTLEREPNQPLLVLVDEIFRGTNNRERVIGSRSYIRTLVSQNAFGAVATHDLELVKLADEIPGIVNFHFREEIRDGRMCFDFTFRPGPCPTTNALKIMRIEGLPVEEGY